MTVKKKIQEYLRYKGITPTSAERELNWGVGAFTKAKSITADRVKELLLLYNDLSAEWLLRDVGEMILTESSSQGSQPTISDNASAELKEEIIALKAENKVLRELTGLGERKESGNKSA